MRVSMSFQERFSGRDDVQPALHIPVVYENLATSPQPWEYRVLSVDPREEGLLDEASLNELGFQGWLLVGIFEPIQPESHPRVHYYFVRRK